jgi:hypothetical protein
MFSIKKSNEPSNTVIHLDKKFDEFKKDIDQLKKDKEELEKLKTLVLDLEHKILKEQKYIDTHTKTQIDPWSTIEISNAKYPTGEDLEIVRSLFCVQRLMKSIRIKHDIYNIFGKVDLQDKDNICIYLVAKTSSLDSFHNASRAIKYIEECTNIHRKSSFDVESNSGSTISMKLTYPQCLTVLTNLYNKPIKDILAAVDNQISQMVDLKRFHDVSKNESVKSIR